MRNEVKSDFHCLAVILSTSAESHSWWLMCSGSSPSQISSIFAHASLETYITSRPYQSAKIKFEKLQKKTGGTKGPCNESRL
jgi:hypothetical protein